MVASASAYPSSECCNTSLTFGQSARPSVLQLIYNMNKYIKRIPAILLAILPILAGCVDKHEHEHEHEQAESNEHHHEGITLSQKKAKVAGVEVEKVVATTFHGVIHTSGMVMAASCDETTVVATTSGRVANADHISEGIHVGANTTLFTITSAGMQMEEGDPVKRARIEYEKAEREYQRAERLIEDQLITNSELNQIKADYEVAKLTFEALQRNRGAGGVVVKTPRSGFIKQCLVNEGDYVEAGQPLAIITQNQHLYLRAEVPERYFNQLNAIRCAKFRTSYSDHLYDITDMGGHVQSYGRSVEQNNSYIPVIFEFNNTGDVVQGSFADIYLITGDRESIITLPLTAITEEQGLHYVYIREDEDGYRKQEVSLGQEDGERIEILNGIKQGDYVVVRGAMQVKLASASNEIPAHTHNH